jgi:hypothetical protein
MIFTSNEHVLRLMIGEDAILSMEPLALCVLASLRVRLWEGAQAVTFGLLGHLAAPHLQNLALWFTVPSINPRREYHARRHPGNFTDEQFKALGKVELCFDEVKQVHGLATLLPLFQTSRKKGQLIVTPKELGYCNETVQPLFPRYLNRHVLSSTNSM